MVGCLYQQPIEALFLPALCASVGLENCHQQPGEQAAQCCSTPHCSERNASWVNAAEPIRDWNKRPLESWEVWWFAAVDHLSQLSLNRIYRHLSPPPSHEMPLWHMMSCTNQGAGISPGCGFDRPEEWSLQSSGWHSAPHRCACILSWIFWVNVNEYKCYESGPEQVTFRNAPLSLVEPMQGRDIDSASLLCFFLLHMKCSVLFEQLSLLWSFFVCVFWRNADSIYSIPCSGPCKSLWLSVIL